MSARALLAALPSAALLLAASAPPAGSEVHVAVSSLRNDKGMVRACMTAQKKAFPQCERDPAAYTANIPASDAARGLRFAGVKPGTYAIALLHDENANGKADFALGMMPKEGFGFSRDAKIRMGPPSFADAAIEVGDADRDLAIRMRYLF